MADPRLPTEVILLIIQHAIDDAIQTFHDPVFATDLINKEEHDLMISSSHRLIQIAHVNTSIRRLVIEAVRAELVVLKPRREYLDREQQRTYPPGWYDSRWNMCLEVIDILSILLAPLGEDVPWEDRVVRKYMIKLEPSNRAGLDSDGRMR